MSTLPFNILCPSLGEMLVLQHSQLLPPKSLRKPFLENELSLSDNFTSSRYTLYAWPYDWCHQLSTWLPGFGIFKLLIISTGTSCQNKKILHQFFSSTQIFMINVFTISIKKGDPIALHKQQNTFTSIKRLKQSWSSEVYSINHPPTPENIFSFTLSFPQEKNYNPETNKNKQIGGKKNTEEFNYTLWFSWFSQNSLQCQKLIYK